MKIWDSLYVFAVVGLIVGLGLFLIFIIDLNGSIMHEGETITIEGVVTDYDFRDDYFVIEFNNDTEYNIYYDTTSNYDFTVNSKLVIRLHKDNYDGIVFDEIDKHWCIKNIYKVPENLTKG